MTSFKERISRALSGNRCISWQALALTVAFHLSNLTFQLSSRQLSPYDYLVVGAYWVVGLTLLMALAAVTVLRGRAAEGVSPWATIAVYLACGFVLDLGQHAIISGVGDLFTGTVLLLAVVGALETATSLTLMAVLLDTLDLQADASSASLTKHAELEAQREAAATVLAEARANLSDRVEIDVAVPLRSLRDGPLQQMTVTKSVSDAGLVGLANQLQSIAEGTVRTMSHDLVRSGQETGYLKREVSTSTAAAVAPATTSTPGISLAVIKGSLRRPLRASVFMLILTVTSLPVAWALLGPGRGTLATAFFVATAFVANRLAALMIWWTRGYGGWFLAGLIQLVGFCIPGVLLPFAAQEFGLMAFDSQRLVVGCLVIVAFGVGCLCADALLSDRQRALSDLRSTTSLQQWELAQTDIEIVQTRERLAHEMHGGVQGELIAAAMLMRIAADSADIDRHALIAEACTAIDTILDEVEVAARDPHLVDKEVGVTSGLRAICAPWDRVMPVSVTISSADSATLDSWPSVAAGVLTIVREALSNAARHGVAHSANVTIALGPESVSVTVNDDGLGPGPNPTPGLGLSAVTESGGQWTLVPAKPAGTRLAVELPIRLVPAAA